MILQLNEITTVFTNGSISPCWWCMSVVAEFGWGWSDCDVDGSSLGDVTGLGSG